MSGRAAPSHVKHVKVVTTVTDDLRIVPQFIEHYRRLGVSLFIVNITDQKGTGEVVDRCRELFSTVPHVIATVRVGAQTWVTQGEMVRSSILEYCQEEDWVLVPDVDELHEYPEDLFTFFARCNKEGLNLVTGSFLDRITQKGDLPELCATTPLDVQFPFGCQISNRILRVPLVRTVAVRGKLAIERHHSTFGDPFVIKSLAASTIRMTKQPPVVVHHFKWHSRVKAKIEARLRLYESLSAANDSYDEAADECSRLVRYLHRSGGKIDINDPEIEARIVNVHARNSR